MKDAAPDLVDRLNERGVATQYRADFDQDDLRRSQLPIFSYLEVEYDVRVLDSEGTMVSRASGSTVLSFRHHLTIAAFNWRGDPELYKRGMPVFLDALADELSTKLR